jgi:mycothiol synthase
MHTPTLRERPATRDDLAAVVDLYCAYEAEVRGAPDTDPTDVLLDWDEPGFDLATDSRVLEADGRVVGYAVLNPPDADTAIDLRLRSLGLEDRLLAWLEQRRTELHHYAADTDPPLSDVLSARGWTPARRFWRMRRELDATSPDPAWPQGVRVRDFVRPDHERPVHALITSAFAEIGGQAERSFDKWAAFLLETPAFDPSLYLVVEDDAVVVGAALGQANPDYGFVRQLAVAPSHRGRGLALALLHECFRRHRERGLPATVLGVDAGNPTGALALYEKAGMRVVEQFTRWDRPAPD